MSLMHLATCFRKVYLLMHLLNISTVYGSTKLCLTTFERIFSLSVYSPLISLVSDILYSLIKLHPQGLAVDLEALLLALLLLLLMVKS